MQELLLPKNTEKDEITKATSSHQKLPNPPPEEKSFEDLLAQTSNQSNAYLKPPSSFPSVQDIMLSDSDSEDEDGNIKIYKPPPPLNFSAPIPTELRELYKDYDKKFEEAKAKWSTSEKTNIAGYAKSSGGIERDGNSNVKKGFLLDKGTQKPSTSKSERQSSTKAQPSSSKVKSPLEYDIINNGYGGVNLHVECNSDHIILKASGLDEKLFAVLEVHASTNKIVVSVGGSSGNDDNDNSVVVRLTNEVYNLRKDEMSAKSSKKKGTLVIECPFS